jgi:hypothetical protein
MNAKNTILCKSMIQETIARIGSVSKECDGEDREYLHSDYEGDETGEHCCSGCMDCLGLSWRDFM